MTNRVPEPSFYERIAAVFDRLGIISETRIVVGFSGGPDSMFLLRSMAEFFGSERVAAAHLNHALRGSEADEDEAFCRNACETLGIRFFSEKTDVLRFAQKWKTSREDAGRRLRYEFFERCRKAFDAAFVMTGHTMDDQAETVLFRFVKGTGIRGLKGIPEISGTVVRPLLGFSKAEILWWLAWNDVSFRTDSSNTDPAFERNRIRLSVFPELEKINPSAQETLARFSSYAGELDAYFESETEKFLSGGDGFSRRAFEILPTALKKEILSRLYARSHGSGIGFSDGMADEMLRFVSGTIGNRSKRFGGLELSRGRGRIFWKPVQ